MLNESLERPIAILVGGAPIGSARALEVDAASGALQLRDLDALARVFFAERVGPGDPEAALSRLEIRDPATGRVVSAAAAKVRSFSSGTGDLDLTGVDLRISRS